MRLIAFIAAALGLAFVAAPASADTNIARLTPPMAAATAAAPTDAAQYRYRSGYRPSYGYRRYRYRRWTPRYAYRPYRSYRYRSYAYRPRYHNYRGWNRGYHRGWYRGRHRGWRY